MAEKETEAGRRLPESGMDAAEAGVGAETTTTATTTTTTTTTTTITPTTTTTTTTTTTENGQDERTTTTGLSSPTASDNSATPDVEKQAAKRTKLETAIIMGALMMAVALSALDQTIITTALPVISEHFQSSAGYTWIGAAYLLGCAATVPSWGKFSDIWGRKPVILTAAGVFFVGSLLCGISTSITMLIIGRAIQGMGGGGCIILVNICIGDLFSMRNRATYYGLVGGVWALASSVGPVLGGVFTQKASWRWCFYINLPASGLAMIVLFFFLKLHTPKTPLVDGLKAIDWLGCITIIGGVVMLLLGLEFGGVTFPWNSKEVICLIVFGILLLCVFVWVEWKIAEYPLMPMRLFKQSSNIAALAVCFFHGMVFIAGSYYLPLYFQAVLGLAPLMSGVLLLPFALTLSICSGTIGIFIRKTGNYLEPVRAGMLIVAIGQGLFLDLPLIPGWPKIILYQIVAGFGVGPNFQSPLIALQSMIAPRDIATATATFGFTRNMATSVGVVIGGVVFQNGMQSQVGKLRAALGAKTAGLLSGGTAGANVRIVNALPAGQREVAREAFRLALRKMWILFLVASVGGLVASAFIRRQKLSREHQEYKTGLPQRNGKAKRIETKQTQNLPRIMA